MHEIHFSSKQPLRAATYIARSLGADIVTAADDLTSLREQIRGAVRCHFDDGEAPSLANLLFSG